MRFRPVGVIPAGLIEDVPGVTAVTRSGSQVIVTGSGEFATGVTAALGRAHVLVADLRLEQRTLDDAFVALTGRPFDDAGDITHDEKELEAAR